MRYRIVELAEGGAVKTPLPIIYLSDRSATNHKGILERRHPESQYIIIEAE